MAWRRNYVETRRHNNIYNNVHQLCLTTSKSFFVIEASPRNGRPDEQRFNSRQNQYIFLFQSIQTDSEAHTAPIQKVRGTPPLGLKRPRCKSNHAPPSSAENRRAYSCTAIPHTRSLRGTQLSTWQKYLTDGNRDFAKDPLVKFLKRTLNYATSIYSCRPGPDLINSPSIIVLTVHV
jgi:hypothetical protein